MSYRVLVAVIAVAVLATGCGNPSTGGEGGDVKGKVFHSASVTEQGKPRAMVEGTSVQLRFTDDGRLLANAGCNQMQGPVSLDGGKLAVSDLSMTAMGCPSPDLHTQDEWLSKLLSAKPSWRMDGENLVVTGSDTEIVLTPETPATLVGGTWKVDGLITNDAVSSVPGGVVATFAFQQDQVQVFAGCNTATGPYKADGQKIEFVQLAITDKGCEPEVMAVEKAVTELLKGQVSYKLDGRSLTLTAASGAGLHLMK
ncbi:META domain-containing protein [Lentzea sp. PSKA42]|uniref:META domain-containing protein n=1 Tax=Lentzea indica TaxID=2604800 RepID=A0ABX1FFU3_9PSEU|nr:META domain-containing protein [Lentzea indica]NKE57687.1 META domain-containing protein [Lentzea indica]